MQAKNSPPIRCPRCGGALIRQANGTYKCNGCGGKTIPVK